MLALRIIFSNESNKFYKIWSCNTLVRYRSFLQFNAENTSKETNLINEMNPKLN